MNRKVTLLLTLLFMGYFTPVNAQCPANIDFELGTYANWLYYTGTCCPINTPTLSGPVAGRHQLTTGAGIDPFGFFNVVSPGGGSYSLQLGTTATNYLAERATYNVHVPSAPGIYSLIYRYAIVLENPVGHGPSVQPHMEVTSYDSATHTTVPCTSYTYVSSPSVPGFLLSSVPGWGGDAVYYKPWTLGNMKFPGLGGRTVTVDFAVGDCGAGGHFGYCYIDMSCGFFANSLITCASGTTVLSGPDGFSSYAWYDSATFSTSYGSSQIVTITSPTTTTVYAVVIVPYTGYGCPDTLYTRVVPSSLFLSMSHDTAICSGNSLTLTSGATTLSPPMTYVWSPSSTLSCSTCATPVATPTATTTYSVTVTDGAGCIKRGTTTVTVVPTPCAIGGPASVCPTFTVTETDCAPGGLWTVSPTTVATIGASSGALTGVATAGGIATVMYTTGGICSVTRTVTVLAAPAAILPASPRICQGDHITLTDATPGGVWSDVCCTLYATVGSSSGDVTGVVTGITTSATATITYTAPTGCTTTKVVTIDPLPGAITGYNNVCVNGTTTLFSSTSGGTWSTTSSTVTVNPTTGVVYGVSAGPATITYSTPPSGCFRTFGVTVNPLPAPIGGPTHECLGTSVTLTDGTGGGIWSATTSGVVLDIDPSTGIISTYTPGIDTILYTVTYPSGASCSATSIDTVLAPPSVSGTTSMCQGTTTTLSSPGTVTWSSSNTAIATVGSSSGVVFGVSAGTANITCFSTAGCITVTPVLVYPLPLPMVGPTSVCVLSTISLTDPTTPGFFSTTPGTWATVTPTGTVTGVAVGVEIITYTESAHNCSRTMPVTVNNTPGPITGVLAICPGSTTTLSNIVPGGHWTSSNTAVGTIGSTSGVAYGVGTGTTNITYAIGSGSTCYSMAVLTVNPTPPAILPASPQVCVSGTTTLTDAATPGTWTSSCPSILTVGLSSGVVSGVSTGACTVTFTNTATTCSTTKVVTVNPLPLPIAPTSPTVCQGATLSLTDPSGGGTWSASPLTIGSIVPTSGVLTGILPGTVVVKYTLPTTCFTQATVTVNPLPSLFTVTGGGAFCAGGAGMGIGLSNSQVGVNYQLSLSGSPIGPIVAGTGAAISFGPQTTAGVYTVVATNATTGCSRTMTGSATITVNSNPPPIVGPSALCVGAAVTLTDGSPGGSWYSSNTLAATVVVGPSSTTTVTGVTTGLTTTISYILPTGCYATHPMTVSPSPSALAGLSSVCVGACITLTDAVPGGTFSATNTRATVTPFGGSVCGVTAGVDTIIYSLGTGCTTSMPITITAAPLPITGTHNMCAGDCDTFHDATIGGSWLLDPGSVGMGTIGAGTGIFCAAGTASGPAIISYAAAGGTGCAVAFNLTINPIPSAISGSNQVCVGSTTPLGSTPTGGTWSITPTTYASIGATTGILSGTFAGSPSTVKYTAAGCSVTMPVTVNPLPSAISGTARVCTGSTTTLTSGATAGTWTTGTGSLLSVASGPSTSTVVSGIAVGIGSVTYTLPTGCLRSTPVTVNQTPGAIAGPATVCIGQSVTMTDPTVGGTWSSSNTAIATIGASSGVINGLTSGCVTITYTVGSCYATTSFCVVAPPAAIVGPDQVCVGSCVTYTDPTTGGVWTSSMPSYATVSTAGVVCGVSSGTVIISYGAGSGCQSVKAIVVNPVAPILGPNLVCEGQNIHLIDTALGGSWLSSNTGVATVSTGGIVHGVAGGVVTIDYLLPTTCMATVSITVNPMPAPITGVTHGCVGQNVPLATTSTGGVWTSSNPGVAAIDPSSGMVTCYSPGFTTISYTYTSTTGCATTTTFTVNANPPAISGPNLLCIAGTITLTDAGIGTWSSSATGIATVGPTSGVVTGVATGPATITFTGTATGCWVTHPVSVIVAPAAVVGPDNVCVGSTTAYTDASAPGLWSSSSMAVGTIDASGTFTALTPGVTTINFSLGGGCNSVLPVTVNPIPCGIVGASNLCVGATATLTNCLPGGTWSSSDTTVATINPATGFAVGIAPGVTVITYMMPTGCSVTSIISVNAGPAPISGPGLLCVGNCTSLFDATPGGTWSSSSTVATIDAYGTVCGITAGSTVISYMVTGSICPSVLPMSINPHPGGITGPAQLCQGSTGTMSNVVTGGIWSSSMPGIGSIDPSTGVLTAIVTGISTPVVVTIFYSAGSGCDTFTDVVVNPLPDAIAGPSAVCEGQSITLSDATPGGTWSALPMTVGTIDGFGNVTGLVAGILTASYTNSFLCAVNHIVTVNPSPSPITGATNVCLGGTSTLHNAVAGGTWWSVNPLVGSIDPVTGVVTGRSLGTTTIGYMLPGGCFTTINITVYPLPTIYTVTGGGNHCAGDAGVPIGLTGSDIGVNYMVFRGATAVGAFAGTGSALSCGLFTVAGTYTIVGTSTATGCGVNMAGSASVGVIPNVIPTVSVVASPSLVVCAGTTVNFTSTITNGGSTPGYEWSVNSSPVALTPTYSFIPADGDIVKLTLTSSANCALPVVVSAYKVVTVNPFANPTVTLSPSPNDTVCEGTTVTLDAVTTYAGTAPVFTWIKNNYPQASTTAPFNFIPINNDVVYVVLNSSYPCRTASADTSAKMRFNVETAVLPIVSIDAKPGTSIGPGQSDTLTASATHVVNPTYQWYVNGIPVPGATSNKFISASFSTVKEDSVSCMVTSHGICTISSHQWVYIDVTSVGVKPVTNGISDINVLPNPNKGEFVVKGSFGTLSDEDVTIEVTDILGQVVYKNATIAKGGKLNENVRLSGNIANGMYVLSVRSANENRIFHLVVEQ